MEHIPRTELGLTQKGEGIHSLVVLAGPPAMSRESGASCGFDLECVTQRCEGLFEDGSRAKAAARRTHARRVCERVCGVSVYILLASVK